jgi:hypothetical protein
MVRVILLPDDESFEELLGLRRTVAEALANAELEVTAVGVLEYETDDLRVVE